MAGSRAEKIDERSLAGDKNETRGRPTTATAKGYSRGGFIRHRVGDQDLCELGKRGLVTRIQERTDSKKSIKRGK